MEFKVRTIYDCLLKIIVELYKEDFLRFLGIKLKIEEILKTEIQVLHGKYYYLDFLCLLSNKRLYNIEFQFKKPTDDDYERFYNYNISAETSKGKITDSLIFRFDSFKNEKERIEIGENKIFKFIYFYLGDVNFDEYFRNIKIKVNEYNESKIINTFSSDEEIALLLRSLDAKCHNKAEILSKVYDLLELEKLFEKDRFGVFKSILKLELDNLISKEERMEIINKHDKNLMEEISMSPEVLEDIQRSINEFNEKDRVLEIDNIKKEADEKIAKAQKEAQEEANKKITEAQEKAQEEANKKITEAQEKAQEEANKTIKIIKNLKNNYSIEEIAEITELSIEEVEEYINEL